MELDFSKLEEIAAGGFKDPAKKDELIAEGYRVVEDAESPFTAPPAVGGIKVPPAPERPATGRSAPLNTYKKMYRAAWDFHEAHNPPVVDLEYWKTHTPGTDEPPPAELTYWEKTAQDIAETATRYGNDPFIIGLLTTIMDELGREYEKRRS